MGQYPVLQERAGKPRLQYWNSQTPITPVIVGTMEKAQELSRRLYEEEKIFVNAVSYPVVPKGTDRIRTIVNAHHTREQLEYALAALERIGKSLKII